MLITGLFMLIDTEKVKEILLDRSVTGYALWKATGKIKVGNPAFFVFITAIIEIVYLNEN